MMRSMSVAFCALVVSVVSSSTVWATPPISDVWAARYPTSTLVERLGCNVCHHPPGLTTAGNCYRIALKALLDQGMGTLEAIDQLDSEDSDGDGALDGIEILLPHADLPGEIGYCPGLVGPTGTDPCGTGEDVSGTAETPPAAIPTLSEWGMLMMTALVLAVGTCVISRRRAAAA